ncbi:ATP-binding protein [Listeria booriae]|nr:ATP-binding protein [Listeria booriae]
MTNIDQINAQIVAVFPDKVKVSVDDIENFQLVDEKLKVGSYLRVADNEDAILIAIIENFTIEINDASARKYFIEAKPLGIIRNGIFERGGDTIAIPPKLVEPAKREEVQKIFDDSLDNKNKFTFSKLATDNSITVPIDGNVFFNKHIAVVGSTGSGKSHSVAKIIQQAIDSKESEYSGLNNAHIIIFDIHSEYNTAFPTANIINSSNLILPYWLLNAEELQELFLDTESNDYNQRNVFKEAIVANKKKHFVGDDAKREKIHLDSPTKFDINEVIQYIKNRNNERKEKNIIKFDVDGESYAFNKENMGKLFKKDVSYITGSGSSTGGLNGKLNNFIDRLENKANDIRLEFILGENAKNSTFEETINNIMGYGQNKSNVTILDLSGVPFDVLSITVSVVSRMMFEYGYYYKRLRHTKDKEEACNNDTPFLLVYEEAHKYAPNNDLVKYRSSKKSIERIAKEGRKYGISLLLASQRPSEISETIFSQCSNFMALRLTNPNDQNYVKRLLPDTLGNLIDKLPILRAGECLFIGDAIALPSVVQVEKCKLEPSSNNIPYFELWKEKWIDLDMEAIKKLWHDD